MVWTLDWLNPVCAVNKFPYNSAVWAGELKVVIKPQIEKTDGKPYFTESVHTG